MLGYSFSKERDRLGTVSVGGGGGQNARLANDVVMKPSLLHKKQGRGKR